jgi:hypothetical protein
MGDDKSVIQNGWMRVLLWHEQYFSCVISICVLQETYQTSFNAEVRAAAIFALGCCINSSIAPSESPTPTERDRELFKLEQDVLMLMHLAATDGSMLVRVECAIAIGRAAVIPASNVLHGGETELCHHDQFLEAFKNQRARVLLDMNHKRMSMMMLAPTLNHSDAGAVTPDTSESRRGGLRGTHSDGHVSHERWLSGDNRVHAGVARSETDMPSTRVHAPFHAAGAVLAPLDTQDLESEGIDFQPRHVVQGVLCCTPCGLSAVISVYEGSTEEALAGALAEACVLYQSGV